MAAAHLRLQNISPFLTKARPSCIFTYPWVLWTSAHHSPHHFRARASDTPRDISYSSNFSLLKNIMGTTRVVILHLFSYLAAVLCYYVSFRLLQRNTDWQVSNTKVGAALLLGVPYCIVGCPVSIGIIMYEIIRLSRRKPGLFRRQPCLWYMVPAVIIFNIITWPYLIYQHMLLKVITLG